MKRNLLKFAALTLIAVLGVSCAPQTAPAAAEPVAAEAALTLSGPATGVSWSMEDLQAYPATETDYTNKDGETATYTGVAFSALLAEVGIESFSSLTMVAADDYTADVTFDELAACPNCIVAFDDGSLRSVMPDLSGKLQVKDLVEIRINQ
ncbi:MAG: hypothetical protein FJZ98_03995 [Chloroflexi bacterium]|nr:hypothetical protein [Chloroflexota bacterium]